MPRKTTIRHKKSTIRRREIIRAALACFGEYGFANTTMEDIRLRSGASNGSIYHHYASKEGLAAAIYVEALIDYQKTILATLERNPGAREGVHALVHAHLDWVDRNRSWARYLIEMRHAEFMTPAEEDIAEANKKFISSFIAWLRPNVKSGAVRRMAADLFISLILGPCQEYVRNWIGGNAYTDLPTAKQELAKAAWLVVRGDEQT
jgi:AcrR family transcriptional regulator